MNASATFLKNLLDESSNHPKIKETIKVILQTREKVTYHSIISSTETYLHVRGLANHDYDQFNYINKLLHSKILGVTAKIKRQELGLKNRIQEYEEAEREKEREERKMAEQLSAEVEYVVNNMDLPLSLFKRNDKYWYPDNPKTQEAKKYVHDRINQDRERKRKVRSQVMKIQGEREKKTKSILQREHKHEEEMKRKKQQEIKNKIDNWEKTKTERAKLIEESQKYGSALKPLFKKIQNVEHKKEQSSLSEYKQKLAEIRRLHRSIQIGEIKQHRDKLMKLEREREKKKVVNDPLKVSFKSRYYNTIVSKSRISEYETTKSLYEKRKEYGVMVKQEFKPEINQELAHEMEERLKVMARKRTRKNPKKKNEKKKGKDSDDEDDEDYDEDEESRKPETPKKSLNFNSDDEDEDDEDFDDDREPPRIRGEDEDPDWKQRYEMGVNYLEYVRSLPKKKKQEKTEVPEANEELTAEEKKAEYMSRYKDYLREMRKTERATTNLINTNSIKKDYNKSIIKTSDFDVFDRLENQARKVQVKIKNEEQLLKYRKMKDQEVMEKKVEIDNAVIDTIKARLSMMS